MTTHVSQRIRTDPNDNLACSVLGCILGYMKNVNKVLKYLIMSICKDRSLDYVSILLGSGVITFYVMVIYTSMFG